MIKAAAYAGISTGPANVGGAQNAWVMNYANHSRIQQTGQIEEIELNIESVPDELTGLYFSVWRFNGLTFDRVASCNIINQITPGLQRLALRVPIPVQIGDLTGIDWTGSSHVPNFMTGIPCPYGCLYSVTEPAYTGFNWHNQPAVSLYVPIQVYMKTPAVIFIGDSLVSGYPHYYPPSCGLGTGGDITTTFPDKVARPFLWTYQNAGAGGQRTDQILARFQADVIDKKPLWVFIDGGANDIKQGMSAVDTLANITAMIDLCHANGIRAFYSLVPPLTNATDLESVAADELNQNIIILCNAKGVIVIDYRAAVGEYRPNGGMWNMRPEYDCGDGVHANNAGNTAIAEVFINDINNFLYG